MGRALGLLILLIAPLLPVAGASGQLEERLVSFHGETPLVGDVLAGARVLEAFPFAGVALMAGPPAAFDALSSLPSVAGVYREEPLTPALDRAREAIHADLGPAGPSGSGVTVALVDSGIDFSHPAFADRVASSVRISRGGVVSGGGSDVDGHGTHVAGIIAGSGAYSKDARHHGVAPGARLAGVDISDSFTTTNAVRAFEWIHENRAAHGIRVVTNSWGREKADAHYDPDDPVIRASDALAADGLVVVFSAGNRGRDGSMTLTSEAMNPNVLAVGASSLAGRVEAYSSTGPARDASGAVLSWVKPDLVAPGTAILSTRSSMLAPASPASEEERYYVEMNGTSMAAPQVAAAAALLFEKHPDYSATLVMELLTRTARDVGEVGADARSGYGMLDVSAALAAADGVAREPQTVLVETRVPVHAEGSVLAVDRTVLLTGTTPRLPPGQAVEVPVLAPKGTARADLWFNWSGPGSFDVRFDGARDGFERVGGTSLHYSGPLSPGARVLVATPNGVASSTPFTLDGTLLVRESRLEDAPAEFHSRAATLRPGGFNVQGSPLELLEANLETVIAFVVALSVVASVVLLRRK